jgi:hypothetical protein
MAARRAEIGEYDGSNGRSFVAVRRSEIFPRAALRVPEYRPERLPATIGPLATLTALWAEAVANPADHFDQ